MSVVDAVHLLRHTLFAVAPNFAMFQKIVRDFPEENFIGIRPKYTVLDFALNIDAERIRKSLGRKLLSSAHAMLINVIHKPSGLFLARSRLPYTFANACHDADSTNSMRTMRF